MTGLSANKIAKAIRIDAFHDASGASHMVGSDGEIFLNHLKYGPDGKAIKNMPFLQRLASGQANQATWKLWGVQRYHAAHSFIDFLESAKTKARAAGLQRITNEITHNIHDEKGVSRKDGVTPTKDGSHENWRQKFYAKMDIDELMIKNTPRLSETTEFTQYMHSIQETASAWQHIGALFATECMVPLEFSYVGHGLNNTPHLKETFNADNAQGRSNGLYIYHHIDHDIMRHAPHFFSATLKDLAKDPGEYFSHWDMLENGASQMREMRTKFYAALETEAQKLQPKFTAPEY